MKTQQAHDINNIRPGEIEPKTAFRAQRLFSIGHDWYFNTREGINMGPFFTKEIAEKAIENYINGIQNMDRLKNLPSSFGA